MNALLGTKKNSTLFLKVNTNIGCINTLQKCITHFNDSHAHSLQVHSDILKCICTLCVQTIVKFIQFAHFLYCTNLRTSNSVNKVFFIKKSSHYFRSLGNNLEFYENVCTRFNSAEILAFARSNHASTSSRVFSSVIFALVVRFRVLVHDLTCDII